jgi:iron complex transport system ATP-binding protein
VTLLSLRDLRAELGGRTVLDGVGLDIAPGEFVGLIGPNGAGKSTLLRAALSLTPSSGGISLAGRDARTMSARERALVASYLPQEREIAWSMTVERLVWLGRSPHRAAFTPLGPADTEVVERAFGLMEIDQFRSRSATALSGGEKARVLVARALAQDTPLLLADEPTAGLDPSHQIALMRILSDLARAGRGVVACLHDLGLAARWCTRLVLMNGGRLVADGAPTAVLTPERLRDVYNVQAYVAEHAGGPIVQPFDLASAGERRS